jgi:hypothetical protein
MEPDEEDLQDAEMYEATEDYEMQRAEAAYEKWKEARKYGHLEEDES